MTAADLEAIRTAAAPVVVERREVVDLAAWGDLVRLLADLLYPANPDEPRQR